MSPIVLAFLIGAVAGLRSLTAPAAVSWAARAGWLRLQDTGLAFLGFAATPYLLSAVAARDSHAASRRARPLRPPGRAARRPGPAAERVPSSGPGHPAAVRLGVGSSAAN